MRTLLMLVTCTLVIHSCNGSPVISEVVTKSTLSVSGDKSVHLLVSQNKSSSESGNSSTSLPTISPSARESVTQRELTVKGLPESHSHVPVATHVNETSHTESTGGRSMNTDEKKHLFASDSRKVSNVNSLGDAVNAMKHNDTSSRVSVQKIASTVAAVSTIKSIGSESGREAIDGEASQVISSYEVTPSAVSTVEQSTDDAAVVDVNNRKHAVKARKGVKEYPLEVDKSTLLDVRSLTVPADGKFNSIDKSSLDTRDTLISQSEVHRSSESVTSPLEQDAHLKSVPLNLSSSTALMSHDSHEGASQMTLPSGERVTNLHSNGEEISPLRNDSKSSQSLTRKKGSLKPEEDSSHNKERDTSDSKSSDLQETFHKKMSPLPTADVTNVTSVSAKERRKSNEKLIEEHFHVLIGLCLAFILLVYVLIHVVVTIHDVLKRRRYGAMFESRRLIDQNLCDDEA